MSQTKLTRQVPCSRVQGLAIAPSSSSSLRHDTVQLQHERKGIRVVRENSMGRNAGTWGDSAGDKAHAPEDLRSVFPSEMLGTQ